jgi:predicted TIM-barrel fold metal-dependent hydrolase
VIGGSPASQDFKEYLVRHAASGLVKGVRQVLHAPKAPRGKCLTDEFVRGVRILGKRGLSFDLCMRPTELADAVRLSELCPETRFILDHCGNADPKAFQAKRDPSDKPLHEVDEWRRGIDALAARSNVICKISGIVARAPKGWQARDLAPIVNHCLDAFGPDRVVFGGDWPVCLLGAALREWVEALRQIVAGRSLADQRKLWSANARRFYGLA